MAVDCERVIWEGADLAATNDALIRKAECYKQLGRYPDASATLSRVRMFALLPEERRQVLYQQELCYFLSGEFNQACSIVEELDDDSPQTLMLHALSLAYAGRYDESEIYAARFISCDGPSARLQQLLDLYASHPVPRSSAAAMALSFLPPCGHIYNGRPAEGLLSAGLNAAALGFTVANLLGGYWITGLLGGGILLNYTFMGGQQRNAALVDMVNNDAALEFGDRVRDFLSETSKQ